MGKKNWSSTVTLLLVSLLLAVACSGGEEEVAQGEPLATEPPPEAPDVIESLAPIESINTLVSETAPRQYFLVVDAGLTHGCMEFDRFEVKREGNLIQVSLINREPAEGSAGCTEEYRIEQHQIPLGDELLPDTTYTLLVNDQSHSLLTGSGAPSEVLSAQPAPSAEPTSQPREVEEVVPNPVAVEGLDGGCAPPVDWYGHAILPGETLFGLALRTGSTVEALAEANCLSDPSQLVAGQTILLPAPGAAGDAVASEFAQFFLILPGDGGVSGPPVGCGDSAAAVSRARPLTGVLLEDIKASLEELFAANATEYTTLGYDHPLAQAVLSVTGVSQNESTLAVTLAGQLPLVGACADPLMEGQILNTIFQYEGFDALQIFIDGQNLKQMLDNSGTVGEDALYLRASLTLP